MYDPPYPGVSMGYAHFGMVPRHQEQILHIPRTHTYPPLAPPFSHVNFPYSDQRKVFYSSPDLHTQPLIPGQTRIHVPQAGSYPEANDPYDDMGGGFASGDDAFIPTSDADIRRFLGLLPNQELSLNALADPPSGQRPGQTIPALSQLAILGSPRKQLTLQGIYQALEDRFEWFRSNRDDKSWQVSRYWRASRIGHQTSWFQNSIRHNLSLYKCFRRIAKPITEPGKGSYWVVDYTRGVGTKRPRKRRDKRSKNAQDDAMQVDDSDKDAKEEEASEDEGFPSPAHSSQGIPSDYGRSHQVGHSRPTARTGPRRGGSPYATPTNALTQVRHGRHDSAPNLPPLQDTRQYPMGYPSSPFGQGTFSQPHAASQWQPLPNPGHFSDPRQLPPPFVHPMADPWAVATQGGAYRSPARSHTLPAPSGAVHPPYPHQQTLPSIHQLADPRYASRGSGPHGHDGMYSPQEFEEGSSRNHRREGQGSEPSRR